MWKVLLAVFAVLYVAVLELGKHTLLGWGLFILVLAGYIYLRGTRFPQPSFGLRLGMTLGLLISCALILLVSWPPVRAVAAVEGSSKETAVIHTNVGDLSGVYTADEKVVVFAGIPYAKPPVGELRWKKPVPYGGWEGVLKADHFAPMSMQTQNLPIIDSLTRIIGYHDYKISLKDNYRTPASEDSLYLNIWKPAGEKKTLPVLVYIHGGSLQTGQPWYADYSGEGLARQDIIVVNMGYRLGIFGFYADEQLLKEEGTTGNYGLLDQICALQWVKDNIEAFGGDPGNITVSGESAGSACVTALCTSSLAQGLFDKVIAESSTVTAETPAHSYRSLERALRAGEETRRIYNVSSVEELRALPAEKIVGELNSHHHITVDGYVLTEDPWESYEKGVHNETVRLHGFNRQEAAPFILFDRVSLKNYEEHVLRMLGEEKGRKALALYPATSDSEARKNWADIYSVYFFTYGHYCWDRQGQQNGLTSYEYLFARENGRLGSWHSGEEVYFYGNIPEDSKLYDETDRELGRIMTQYFANFIRTGDPNGEGLPHWQANTGYQGRVMLLDSQVKMANDPFHALCQILEGK